MNPLVSIVTPSLNQGPFIERTIRSVLDQDYEAIEYSVYDAGSTDGTHATLDRYRERVCIIIRPDGGQADAINSGLRAARGDIVAWLNSDDCYLPGAVSAAVAYLTDHPDCAMVYGDAQYIDEAGQVTGRYPTGPIARLTEGCYICQPAVFLRREAVAAAGYLDATLQYCMDYDLWLRLAPHEKITHLPIDLACSRLHPAAKTIAHALAFHREVVRMTHRRLGATPLPWLYGYAALLVGERLGRRDGRRPLTTLPRVMISAALTCALALRYHRTLGRADLHLLLTRLAGRPAAR